MLEILYAQLFISLLVLFGIFSMWGTLKIVFKVLDQSDIEILKAWSVFLGIVVFIFSVLDIILLFEEG